MAHTPIYCILIDSVRVMGQQNPFSDGAEMGMRKSCIAILSPPRVLQVPESGLELVGRNGVSGGSLGGRFSFNFSCYELHFGEMLLWNKASCNSYECLLGTLQAVGEKSSTCGGEVLGLSLLQCYWLQSSLLCF